MAVFHLIDVDAQQADAPAWFVVWTRLGMEIAQWAASSGSSDTRRTIVVSAPSEAMAAAALGLGFVRSTFLEQSGQTADGLIPLTNPDDLEADQWILFRAGSSIRTAKYYGVDGRGALRTSNGLFLRDHIKEVRLLPSWFPQREEKADAKTLPLPFLAQLVRDRDPERFATEWVTSLLIIGSTARMDEELDIQFSPAVASPVFGSFRDFLRPLTTDQPFGCRSVIASAHAQDAQWQEWAVPPLLTVLRGAYATSRWLSEVTSRFVVSILGRGETGLDAAMSAVMQARSYADPLTYTQLGWHAPKGCEILAYEEAL